MLLQLESVVLFVHDIDAASAWYAALLGVPVEHENPRYAFVRAAPRCIAAPATPTSARAWRC